MPPRRALAIIGLAGLAFAVVFFVLPYALVPDSGLSPEQRLEAESDIRTAGLQLLGGLVLATGAYFAARDVLANREKQITERFATAVNLLGHDGRVVRAGAIYALERIGRDSTRDHPAIVQLLTAFVREGAQGPDELRSAGEKPRPPADVQAAVTVLARRDVALDGPHTELRLSRVHLQGANLRGARFAGARLRGARLDHARLEGAVLTEAELRGASLRQADLKPNSEFGLGGADLRGADLEGADLQGTELAGARYDARTTWPRGFRPEARGCLLVERSARATRG